MAEDTAPIVRIRELKKDSVNFVLENVDLAALGLGESEKTVIRCAALIIISYV